MKLFLFLTAQGDPFPVVELTPVSPPDKTLSTGRWSRIKGEIGRIYQGLVSRLDYHERLCSQFRSAPHLQIYYPSLLNSDQAREQVNGFCRARARKHTLWMWINGILAAFGALLVPVPGPNIFFFYPAARCLGHYSARRGSRRVLGEIELEFGNEPLLEEIQGLMPDLERARDAMLRLGKRYNLGDLEQILRPLSEDRERK